ncbi:uncharacterized protein EV422DRAFT_508380 [Fimicolochytrium jonesii]|uniref:uncharacterized protein n=1 Tax=Fimicolochytrium jonesii TaxID=1396493 RepID=UPI0022FDCF97|nr:uncharacterized protein EV422DRAFT_508380 [Fimicolochytrium jonesii]KAI8818164.1 hypothetical protein EV422DRAFT_508380 [Fimicolochytrium jonesii]
MSTSGSRQRPSVLHKAGCKRLFMRCRRLPLQDSAFCAPSFVGMGVMTAPALQPAKSHAKGREVPRSLHSPPLPGPPRPADGGKAVGKAGRKRRKASEVAAIAFPQVHTVQGCPLVCKHWAGGLLPPQRNAGTPAALQPAPARVADDCAAPALARRFPRVLVRASHSTEACITALTAARPQGDNDFYRTEIIIAEDFGNPTPTPPTVNFGAYIYALTGFSCLRPRPVLPLDLHKDSEGNGADDGHEGKGSHYFKCVINQLREKADPDLVPDSSSARWILVSALLHGLLPTVQYLWGRGVNLSHACTVMDRPPGNALDCALRSRSVSTVEYVLTTGMETRADTFFNPSVLEMRNDNDWKIFDILVKERLTLLSGILTVHEDKEYFIERLAELAGERRDSGIIRFLIDNKCDVSPALVGVLAPASQESTCQSMDDPFLAMLLAKIPQEGPSWQQAVLKSLCRALVRGNEELIYFLIDKGAKVPVAWITSFNPTSSDSTTRKMHLLRETSFERLRNTEIRFRTLPLPKLSARLHSVGIRSSHKVYESSHPSDAE